MSLENENEFNPKIYNICSAKLKMNFINIKQLLRQLTII